MVTGKGSKRDYLIPPPPHPLLVSFPTPTETALLEKGLCTWSQGCRTPPDRTAFRFAWIPAWARHRPSSYRLLRSKRSRGLLANPAVAMPRRWSSPGLRSMGRSRWFKLISPRNSSPREYIILQLLWLRTLLVHTIDLAVWPALQRAGLCDAPDTLVGSSYVGELSKLHSGRFCWCHDTARNA